MWFSWFYTTCIRVAVEFLIVLWFFIHRPVYIYKGSLSDSTHCLCTIELWYDLHRSRFITTPSPDVTSMHLTYVIVPPPKENLTFTYHPVSLRPFDGYNNFIVRATTVNKKKTPPVDMVSSVIGADVAEMLSPYVVGVRWR